MVIAETVDGCTTSATILMNENLVAPGTINTASTTICFGEEASPIFNVTSATVSGAILYEWEASFDNGLTFNTYPSFRIPIHLLFLKLISNNLLEEKQPVIFQVSHPVLSNTITVTVLPQVIGGTITPTNLTVCSGEVPPQLNVVSGTLGLGVSYNWEVSPDGVSQV